MARRLALRDAVAVAAAIALPLIGDPRRFGIDLGPFGPPSLYLLAVVAAAAIGGVGSGLAVSRLSRSLG